MPIFGTPGAAYLLGRGIPTEVAAPARVGYAPHWRHWVKEGDAWRLLGDDRRVVFSIRDRHGLLVGISARAIDADHVGPKVFTLGEAKRGVFVTDGGLGADPVIVCEAPIDALSLAACGFPSVALNGTAWPDWLPSEVAFRTVLIATDADDAGIAAVDRLVAAFTFGTHSYRLAPPTGKDWNEAIQVLGHDSLSRCLHGAMTTLPSRGRHTRQDTVAQAVQKNVGLMSTAEAVGPPTQVERMRALGFVPNADGLGWVIMPERAATCVNQSDQPLVPGDNLFCVACQVLRLPIGGAHHGDCGEGSDSRLSNGEDAL